MTCRLSLLRRHRGWVVIVAVTVVVMVGVGVMEGQTRGYSHTRDIFTSPFHHTQPLLLLPPENGNISSNMKYKGEDELTDILMRRLQEFSRDRKNLHTPFCTDPWVQSDDACYDPSCTGTFSPSPRQRLRQVLATRRQIPEAYLQALAAVTARLEAHKYLFVSGASSNHYYEMQGLLHSLHTNVFPRLDNATLVIFDLGLTAFERYVTEKNCQCTVLDFPFSELPEFVRHLTCFSWKPIVIASLIEKSEYLVWMDASVRWKSQCPLNTIFQRCQNRGFLTINDFGSIAVRTANSLFQFHGDQQCQYSPFTEMLGGFQMLYNDRFTREAVIQPWLSCAYDQRCMCIKDHVWMFNCPSSPPRGYGRCHRYDQSGIGVIQSKLLLDQRPLIYLPKGCVHVAKEVKMNWFEPRKADMFAFVAGMVVVVNVWMCGVALVLCSWSQGGGGGGGGFKSDSVRWWRTVVAVWIVETVFVGFLLWVFV